MTKPVIWKENLSMVCRKMTSILIITTAIAAFLAIRAMCEAVRIMRYHQRSLDVPFAEYVIERERETNRHVTALFYHADMERKYGR